MPPSSDSPLLEARELRKTFSIGARDVHAVQGVNLDLYPGETFALVGESGSGKSTVARMIMRLLPATSGTVHFAGRDLFTLNGSALREARKHLQMVFQDPMASLNPRMSVGAILREPFLIHRQTAGSERISQLLESVGLPADFARRFPHELSGGQRQRVGIARAIALEPQLVIADEPVSALDVSVRAQIINLLRELQESRGLAYLFIAHDLALVKQISHRVGVMNRGRIVELASPALLFDAPRHPYTQRLLSAIPSVRHPGSIYERPSHPQEFPTDAPLQEVAPGHWVADVRTF